MLAAIIIAFLPAFSSRSKLTWASLEVFTNFETFNSLVVLLL